MVGLQASRGGHYLRIALHTLLWCLAVGVLTQNIVLLRQNRELRLLASVQDPEVGMRVDNLAAVSLDGALTPITPPQAASDRLLVIAMSPGCPICQANKSAFVAITITTNLQRRSGWRVVWVSRDSVLVTRKYCQKENIPASGVLADPTHGTFLQLGLQKVPHIIALRSDGTIDRVWLGRLDTATLTDILSYSGVLTKTAWPVNATNTIRKRRKV